MFYQNVVARYLAALDLWRDPNLVSHWGGGPGIGRQP